MLCVVWGDSDEYARILTVDHACTYLGTAKEMTNIEQATLPGASCVLFFVIVQSSW